MPSLWDLLGFKSSVPKDPSPFSTQFEVLEKYGQATNVSGNVVGMCDSMTNAYAAELLEGRDPSDLLKDDRRFLQQSTRIENTQNYARKVGGSHTEHYAYTTTNTPHQDLQVDKTDLTQTKVAHLLAKSQHLMFVYPTVTTPGERQAYHESYLGRSGTDLQHGCRFFDANVRGGERKGPCDEIVREFVDVTRKQYAEADKPFVIGASAR